LISTRSGRMPSSFVVPRIEPLPAGTERPLWSVMIPTYNRATYLARALESVLVQDPGRDQMQIEVVDDCSTTDDPEPVVRAIAGDRVTISRNPRNLGLMPNFNRCIERARGHLIQILHSDDWVAPTFYVVLGELAARHPDCAFLASRGFYVDEEEIITGVSPRAKWMEAPTRDVTPMLGPQNFFLPAGVVILRELYERCGGFIPELVYTGDWEMWVRATHCGGGVVYPQPLANWRISARHETGRLARLGENARDYLRLSDHFSRYPGFSASPLCDVAASLALNQYYRFSAEGDLAAAQANLRAYKAVVPFPAWAISGVLNRLRHFLHRVSRFAEKTTRRAFMLGL
jgi:glycosyltransferase involved in cell wall biosynthesis